VNRTATGSRVGVTEGVVGTALDPTVEQAQPSMRQATAPRMAER
jgi:hypothetical protein